MNITVLGAGAWGMSLAHVLHDAGHTIRVWEFVAGLVETLERTRRHPKLPNYAIPGDLHFGADMAEMLRGAEAIVCAVPAEHLRETARRVVQLGHGGQRVIIGSKGIEWGTHALAADVWGQEAGAAGAGKIGVLYGPSLADDVLRSLPTVVVAASGHVALTDSIRTLFMRPWFRVYTDPDVRGIELGGSLKNVIAIACGISDGLGFGTNAKAALMTLGLGDMVRLGVRMGARAETFYGMAGIGDLIATCTSVHGRNWRFGSLIGQGYGAEQALVEVGQVVEGRYTLRSAAELAVEHRVEAPVVRAVHDVVYGGRGAREVFVTLLQSDPGHEGAR
jgi:glycerol-3-phosphate dehydrogenase (NAD(P)+)